MTLVMYDSIQISQLPAGADAYAGYVDGSWPTFNELKRQFPGAHLLSIAVQADADADCLDVETGDATIGQAPGWFRRQVSRGVQRPAIYTEASRLAGLEQTMRANGIARGSYRLWSAHYDGEHFCAPHTCGYGLSPADGTQWTMSALGRNLDQSILSADFFGPPPPPPYSPIQVKPGFWRQVADGTEALTTWAHKRGTFAWLLARHTLRPDSPINAEHRAAFVKYRKSGLFTKMPKGLVFYTYNK